MLAQSTDFKVQTGVVEDMQKAQFADGSNTWQGGGGFNGTGFGGGAV